MQTLQYINRKTGKVETEQVFGEHALKLLYGHSIWCKIFGRPLCFLVARIPLFSFLFGWWHKRSFTKKKIHKFIEHYRIDASEFLLAPDQFRSFNDFFIRKLKADVRPIASGDDLAIMPADGRYLFFPQFLGRTVLS